ncbi:MAG: sigma-70 family RNA polymerase sigma factor [Planctomycetaceae bacterium]
MVSNLDSSVIVQAVAGDDAAQERLLLFCRPLIRVAAKRHLDRFLQRRCDASDVVQMTCMDAHAALPSFRGRSYPELLCWLQTILERNIWKIREEHMGMKRDVRRETRIEDSLSGLSFVWTSAGQGESSPASKLIVGEAALCVAAALEQLPAEFRSVLEMRFLEGMKLAEIASRQDVSLGCVAGRLRRGLALLHEQLPASMVADLGEPHA